MKITIATGIYPPEIGGPATYLRELVPFLKKKGWTVDVITYGAPRKNTITISRQNPLRLLSFLSAVKKSARNSNVILATDTFSSGFPAAIAARSLKKRFIVRFVGDFAWENARNQGLTKDPFKVFQKKKYEWYTEILRKIQRWVLSNAEIITVSNFLQSVLLKWGIKKKNIKVIYNAVPSMKLPARPVLRKKLNFDKKFVILNVGRVTVYKGVDKIVRMCAKLRKDIPELLLFVVGDGPALEAAKKVAKQEMVTHIVNFVGKKDETEVRKYMKSADVLVLNSEYEGMSHTLLEAMSVECPVIASDVCGNPELVKNKGLLFEYNNMDALKEQVLKLYKNTDMRKKLAKKAVKALPVKEKQEKQILEVLG